jgi:hypothetical protein
VASLRELQRAFAAALRDPTVACAVLPPANLAIYRNNARSAFLNALELTFPVLRRRVGDAYFRQLALQYREQSPSRSGDLHWTGRDFAAYLDDHLHGGDYAWLADLARIEWSRAECAVAVALPAIHVGALARYGIHEFEHLVFGLQPSLKLHSSSYPVFSVWLANQVENAPPVDQSLGSECGMILARSDCTEVRLLNERMFGFLSALHAGLPLGDAMTRANLEAEALAGALQFVFSEELVSSLALAEAARGPDGQRVGTSS